MGHQNMGYDLLRGARLAALTLLLTLWVGVASAQTTTGTAVTGQTLFGTKGCSVCHAATGVTKANAINAGGHISHANTQMMGGQADSTGTQYNDIAAYFATLFTDLSTQTVSFGSPSTIPIPKSPEAKPRSLVSKASKSMACDVDSNAPPPMPWINRQKTNSHRLSDAPQK